MKTNLALMILDESDKEQFKSDMSDAFQFYFENGYFPTDEQILPVEEIEQTLCKANSIGYKAVQNGRLVGGAIVSIDKQQQHGSLELLYVKRNTQSQGIGKFMWFEIERFHPDITIWETISDQKRPESDQISDRISDQIKMILELIKEKPQISRSEISHKMGLHESSVKRRLKMIVD